MHGRAPLRLQWRTHRAWKEKRKFTQSVIAHALLRLSSIKKQGFAEILSSSKAPFGLNLISFKGLALPNLSQAQKHRFAKVLSSSQAQLPLNLVIFKCPALPKLSHA